MKMLCVDIICVILKPGVVNNFISNDEIIKCYSKNQVKKTIY